MPLLVAVVAVVTWLVVGRALRPVEAIRSRVAQIGAGDLHQRVPDPGTGDEVGRLAATMNRMLDRLQRSSERQRRFVSDASHELRSPLASLRTQLEVSLAHPEGADWPGVASGVLEEGVRMERLVDDLLALARADEGVVLAHTEELDLGEIVAEEAGRVEGLEVEADVAEARLRGDPQALRRVVRNLLDNARRHASSRIVLRVSLEGDEVVAVVEDDGAGIPEAEREQVFERFARLEERPATATPAAPAWAWRWCARSSRPTGGRWWPRRATRAAPAWWCACRPASRSRAAAAPPPAAEPPGR